MIEPKLSLILVLPGSIMVGKLIRVWDTMSEDARIKKHCELIAHDMGAIGFSYNILGD